VLLTAWTASGIAAVSATDSEGRQISLEKPARRIIALAPHIVENLYSIGAGDYVIGAVQYSDYPAPATAIPRVGGVGAISLERIASLNPDLVVLWGSGSPPAVRSALERLGFEYYVDEIGSLEELASSFLALGRLTGQQGSAEFAATRVQAATGQHPLNLAADISERVTVFLQLWDEPLQSIGPGHVLSEVISRCGGHSISDDSVGLAPRISLERVLADDPALIIVESTAQGRHWQRYPQLRAVANQRVVVIDPDLLHRPTLRLLDGMQAICAQIDKAS
jgi:iron complex transport system substrate-binding protein